MSCLVLVSTCLGFLFAVSVLSWIMASKLCFGKPLHLWGSWQISEVVWRERETTRLESCPAGWLAIRLDSISPALSMVSAALHISLSPLFLKVLSHQLHIISTHDEKVQTPPRQFQIQPIKLMSHSELAQFSEYLTTNIPRRKNSSLILLLLSHFHGNSLFPAPTYSFPSTYNLWWWVKIDVKAFFHWKRSILRVLLYRGQRAWEEKGDSQRETWLLGLKLVNTNPHIGSEYCLYLNSTLTSTLIQFWLYVPFNIPSHQNQNPL